jgi:RNA polymerase sigma-70 factor (ECF subfamily)
LNLDNQHTKQLLKKCKIGDKKAQFAIYKLYYKAMYNCALRIVVDSFEAEDIMQEAFLAAFTKLNSYSEEVSFGAWLKRIVINKCLSSLKTSKKMETVTLDKVPFENFIDEKIDLTNINVSGILKQINNLKTNYRIAISLNLIEGFDYEEIAQIMNISYANSRTTISRAKNKLRTLLIPVYER